MNFYEKEPISLYLDDIEILENVSSSKQNIQIMKHSFLGLVLVINGEIQHIQHFQCMYHELLVHLPISFIKEPKTALIIGGGSLFAAYEVLKYPSIENVTLCDHDCTVLNLMEKYYQHARNIRKDSRFTFVEKDGLQYINSCEKKYDLIINDCFNLLELEKRNIAIYHKLKNLLTTEGVCSDIIYRHIFDGTNTHDSIEKIKKLGPIIMSLVTVPEYPGILHLETLWGKNGNLSQNCKKVINTYQNRILSGGEKNPFDFFSPNNLGFYLYLPPYIKSKII